MKKRMYRIFAFILCFLFVVNLIPDMNPIMSKAEENTSYSGVLMYDANAASGDDTYVPKDTNKYTLTLTEKQKCKFTFESTDGIELLQFAISKGELNYGFYKNIFINDYNESSNNVITVKLDPGVYNLQVSLQNSDDTAAYAEYTLGIEYLAAGEEDENNTAGNDYTDDNYEEYTDDTYASDEEIEPELEITDKTLKLISGMSETLDIKEKQYSTRPSEIGKIEWSSSNKQVATVDKYGMVLAYKSGTCVITGKYKGKKYTCKVTVVKTKFSVPGNINLDYGARKEVEFKVSPKEYILIVPTSYTTTDKKVAIYDADKYEIVAKGAGTCKITFTFCNGQKTTCTVKVKAQTLDQKLKLQAAYSLDDLSIEYNSVSKLYLADIYINNNNKKKDITYVEFAVFQYDNKGTRLNKLNSDFEYNGTISAGDLKIVNSSVTSKVKKVHTCIKKVYYSDGTTWANPLYSKWVKKYADKF